MWWHTVTHEGGGKWRGKWRMDWVASTLHTTSEHGVSSITTADAHTTAASSRLNWRPRRFKWTRPFRGKTKSGFCACAITFQTQSTEHNIVFPNIPSALRPLTHDDCPPILKPPQQWILHEEEPTSNSPEDETVPSCSNVHPEFPELTVPYLIS